VQRTPAAATHASAAAPRAVPTLTSRLEHARHAAAHHTGRHNDPVSQALGFMATMDALAG
jgi:hypothetical protein